MPPDFVSYTLVTADGEVMTGLVIAESAASVTIRRPNAPDATAQRSQIKELKAEGKSMMPDGLEQGLTVQDMADLLSFLQRQIGRSDTCILKRFTRRRESQRNCARHMFAIFRTKL